jgi:hypothetical protein
MAELLPPTAEPEPDARHHALMRWSRAAHRAVLFLNQAVLGGAAAVAAFAPALGLDAAAARAGVVALLLVGVVVGSLQVIATLRPGLRGGALGTSVLLAAAGAGALATGFVLWWLLVPANCTPRAAKLVLDDFARPRAYGEFVWPSGEAGNPAHIVPLVHPGGGCEYLQLSYRVPAPGASAGWGLHLRGLGVGSGARDLVFLVRGSRGGETFQVGFRDRRGIEHRVEIADHLRAITTRWQLARIPLAAFRGVDFSALETVTFSVHHGHGDGTLLIDQLAIE